MVKRIRSLIFDILNDDVRLLRILLFLAGTAFLTFAIFSINVPLRGYIPHRDLNIMASASAFTIWGILTFRNPGQQARFILGTFLIYEVNLMDVYLLYGTEHMDMYAYQFIVIYVVSTYFFSSVRSIVPFVTTINVAVICAAFTSHAKSSSPIDFYMTYVACQAVFFILYRYRFKLEQDLVDNERKYRLLAENSFDLICVHNAKAKVEFASPSAHRLLGFEPEEIVGNYPVSFVHPEDAPVMKGLDFSDPSQPFLQKPVQYRLRHKTGQYIWFETIFTPIDDNNGYNGMVLSQSRDIRRSKSYQQQLEERGKELERSNADLETFAFVSSHDMQEPLRMISNYTQLLKKKYHGQLDKDADEYIEYASKGASNLQQLIRDLLSYSRITNSEIKKVHVSMNDLLREVLKNIELEIKEKNATVLYDDLMTVSGDRNLLMLVVQNLVLNGIKYNRSENPEVKVSYEKHNGTAIFCVADNGFGIDLRHQQQIFEPFKRLHTKAEFPGTGLGLSICKKIVERLGGSIWVLSEAGKGAKFYFSLPAE